MRSFARIGACAALIVGCAAPAVGDEIAAMLQWFETRWSDAERRVADLFLAGYEGVWLPPPSKARDPSSVGYDVFDRFDLGSPGSETAYGTEADYRALVEELHRANVLVYSDSVMNHNSGRDGSVPFQVRGGYPGFWMNSEDPPVPKEIGDDWGDFHDGTAQDEIFGDLVGLIDIAQETNHQFIRHPVDPDDPDNVPAGTVYNRPDPGNARFYPDRDLPASTFTNPGTQRNPGSQEWTVHPFNTENPGAGDPVTGNTTALLMRWTQWMMDVQKVDGFRLDASKHIQTWFWDTFWDVAVHRRLRLPDGRQVTPFSFGENTLGNQETYDRYVRKDGFARRDALDLNGAARLRELIGAGGFGSWDSVISGSGHLDIVDDGLQNGSLGVNHVFSHDNGSVGDGGSLPRFPTFREMGLFAHAYLLMRPGPAIVYHNGRGIDRDFGFFPREGVPIALGWDPIAEQPDDRLLTLLDIRREYRRGFFDILNDTDPSDQSIDDVLVFELAGSGLGGTDGNVLVGASDRYDAGFDIRNVRTSFPPGTRLRERTGNAEDPAIDPDDLVPEVLIVDDDGRVSITVPRNRSSVGQHHGGYVVYAPAVPAGEVELIGTDGMLAADPASRPDVSQRLNEIPIVPGDTLTIALTTTPGDPFDPNTDTDAAFRIDQGFEDWNGNNQVDFGTFDPRTPGYERFLDVNEPLFGSDEDEGRYEQAIDTTRLSEGNHYLSVVAFRNRPDDEAPLYAEWREVIHVDRLPPAIEVVGVDEIVTEPQREFRIRALDRTTNRVHVMWDLPQQADPVEEADLFNEAPRYDRREWRWTVNSGGHGFHRLTVVAFEETGNVSVNDFQVFVDMCDADLTGPGGDGTPDGSLTADDFFFYLGLFASGDAGADLTGPGGDGTPDGSLTADDFFFYLGLFAAGCS